MPPAPTARQVALDLLSAVLRRKRPLDDGIEDNPDMPVLSVRDRAFARLLVATVLRRLGQIDALIADCLNTPLAPRAAIVQDILRLSISQLMFLRTPPHAAVATSVDLAHQRGLLSHKGLVNAVLRRLSVEDPDRVERPDLSALDPPARPAGRQFEPPEIAGRGDRGRCADLAAGSSGRCRAARCALHGDRCDPAPSRCAASEATR